ncbi:MAG TPA: hypothetical protein IAC33_09530 [Candidatus Fimousia stercorigallinarum]|nr:hypothetical protein [Candidatus Fimousia stercorigallinarum]
MGTIIIDFVIDATESSSINLPAINLFCDDLIAKGYRVLAPFHDVSYGITVFYGKEEPVKVYDFKKELFTGDRYLFNRVFDMVCIGQGSADGRDHILGGMMQSGQKLREVKADVKVMLVFSDSYVDKMDAEQAGILSAQSVYLYLADQSELGEVNMTLFWGMPMLNQSDKVDHRLMPQRRRLSDLFDEKKRQERMDEVIDSIIALTE